MFEEHTYLALDQAPRAIGWALGGPRMGEPLTNVVQIPAVGDRHGDMLIMAHNWLERMIEAYPMKKVIFESPFLHPVARLANPGVFAVQNKLIGVIEMLCRKHLVACTEVAPSRWREHFMGCSSAPKSVPKNKRRDWLKALAVQTCADRLWFVNSHDAADACGILDYALSCDFPEYGAKSTPLFLKGAAA